MTVNAFKLENFMAFKDSGWIRLRPICMLFGRNSSGKSALIRALRLLKQSVRCYPGPFVFNQPFGVNLGGYDTVIHAYDPKLPLIFHFRCSIEDHRSLLVPVLNRHLQREDPALRAAEQDIRYLDYTLGFYLDWYDHEVKLCEIQLDCAWVVEGMQWIDTLFSATRLADDDAGFLEDTWSFHSAIFHAHEEEDQETIWEDVHIVLEQGFLPLLSTPARLAYSDQMVDEYNLLYGLLEELKTDITRFVDHINYLGPLRPEPVREYLISEAERRRWEALGWGAFLQFLSNAIDEPKSREIDSWLNHLDMFRGVNANRKQAFSTYVSQVDVDHEAFRVNIADVGFGVSQVLPLIVQAVLAEPNSTTIIEQPELHLHPAAQVELMDLFIQISQTENRRFILETHSELLILRLLKRMRAGKVPPDQVSVMFIERERNEIASEVNTIEVDEEGRLITPWPHGFFEEGYQERFS